MGYLIIEKVFLMVFSSFFVWKRGPSRLLAHWYSAAACLILS